MKKIFAPTLWALTLLYGSGELLAQSQSTALLLSSQLEARGSARYQALSGAMGAIGVDFSSLHQNPAGIAFFRSGGKFSATLSHSNYKSNNTWYGNATKLTTKSQLQFDELSYLTSMRTGTGLGLTFAIGIQNNGRLARNLDAFAMNGLNATIADYVGASTVLAHGNRPASGLDVEQSKSAAWDNRWLSTLAYSSKWIKDYLGTDVSGKPYTRYGNVYGSTPLSASLITNERGAVSNVDFGLGIEFSPVFSLGFVGTLSSMNYEYFSFYKEDFSGANANGDKYGLSLDNDMRLSGFGGRLGVGAILQPVGGLRLGASIYTPTLYGYSMTHNARSTGVDPSSTAKPGRQDTGTPVSESSFRMTTPWRFGFNAAYIFGYRAILSVDYEYQNYGGSRLKATSADDYNTTREELYSADNDAIKSDFGGGHTLRTGLEVNLSPRLALRGGYRYSKAPWYTSDLNLERNAVEMLVPGTAVHYRLPGAISSYSLGLGYKLSREWTLDVAYTMREQNDRVGAFPSIREDSKSGIKYLPLAMIRDRQIQHNVTMTISCKF